MPEVYLDEMIAPPFYSVYRDFRGDKITDFILKGGRGSTKSTFAALMIPLGIMDDAVNGEVTNGIIFRRVALTLRDSVFMQVQKCIEMLGASAYWKVNLSPLRLTYKINGAMIAFEGVDNPTKLKSVTCVKGYFKYAWFEELEEFEGMEHIRSVRQSVLRGGDKFKVFMTFNPPKSATSWVNRESLVESDDRIVHHSTYLDVPEEWLGPQFIREALALKANNLEAYQHEYLGMAVGTGGQIFRNLEFRQLTDEVIRGFDRVKCGLDWGYSPDPLGIIWPAWDPRRKTIYIFDEVYRFSASNKQAADEIKDRKWFGPVICDNAEPKSIADLNGMGVRAVPCRKGRGSIERGMRWLTRGVDKIVIDPKRCPNAVREFSGYEHERNPAGGFKRGYPDKDNHLIDPTRYACQDWMTIINIR